MSAAFILIFGALIVWLGVTGRWTAIMNAVRS